MARQFWNTYVAKTPEVFTYDLDKNLQSDGRWEYSWNSLNQLEKMSLIPTATGTGKARHQVWTFVYDASGRRVAKQFYERYGPDFSAGSFPADYHKLEETLFFYDGWNLIAEVNAFTGDMKTYLTYQRKGRPRCSTCMADEHRLIDPLRP